jgi:nitrile hydratase accessory protein
VNELPTDGRTAPPRVNGGLVFEALWERNVFGVAMAAFEKRLFSWRAFQARLIEAIDAHERAGAAFHYYACWASALERVLLDAELVGEEELAQATREHEALFAHRLPR